MQRRSVLCLVLAASCTAVSPPKPVGRAAPDEAPPIVAPPPETDMRDVSVEIETRVDWYGARALPHNESAVAIHRALRPDGEPYDPAFSVVGTRPENIRRGFVLERNEWLLGEPLVVEFRIEVEGSHPWKEVIGGNYRGRGRDDNFLFILIPKGRAVVPDVYPGEPMMGGGISSAQEFTPEKPLSYWHAVQRYSAVTEPGAYDLYCLGFEHGTEVAGWRAALAASIPATLAGTLQLGDEGNRLVDKATGEPTDVRLSPSWKQQPSRSPIAARLPPALSRLKHLGLDRITDFGHFEIVIREPTAAQRRAMVERWTKAVEAYDESWPSPRGDAAREAMWFARQADFLPLLETWLRSGKGYRPQDLDGLAMRGSDEARRLLLQYGGDTGLGALRMLPRAQVPKVIPALIDRLSHPQAPIRAQAFNLLAQWTGQRFDAGWEGYHSERPTAAEGAALQGQFRRWWAEHRAGFSLLRP